MSFKIEIDSLRCPYYKACFGSLVGNYIKHLCTYEKLKNDETAEECLESRCPFAVKGGK